MRRIIGTRANRRMLTSSGLTFPSGSVTTLAIDRKSSVNFYSFCAIARSDRATKLREVRMPRLQIDRKLSRARQNPLNGDPP